MYLKNIAALNASEVVASKLLGGVPKRSAFGGRDNREAILDSYIREESELYKPQTVAREFMAILDAIYDSTKRK